MVTAAAAGGVGKQDARVAGSGRSLGRQRLLQRQSLGEEESGVAGRDAEGGRRGGGCGGRREDPGTHPGALHRIRRAAGAHLGGHGEVSVCTCPPGCAVRWAQWCTV